MLAAGHPPRALTATSCAVSGSHRAALPGFPSTGVLPALPALLSFQPQQWKFLVCAPLHSYPARVCEVAAPLQAHSLASENMSAALFFQTTPKATELKSPKIPIKLGFVISETLALQGPVLCSCRKMIQLIFLPPTSSSDTNRQHEQHFRY